MPSTICVTHEQLVTLVDLGDNVVLNELPPGSEAVEAWVVLDEDATEYRSVIIDESGGIMSDTQQNEKEEIGGSELGN